MTDYVLEPTHYPGVVTHGGGMPLMVHDGDGFDMDRVELIASVRSGDYLVTLATTLDIISQLLLTANHAERDNLQKIVNDLLYLNSHYELKKKS
jgi:hypothetical protein